MFRFKRAARATPHLVPQSRRANNLLRSGDDGTDQGFVR